MIRFLELRSEKGISQREIAKRFDISQATYNNWENGKTQPSIEQLITLAKFYGVSVDYLIGNSDDAGIINYDKPQLSDEEIQLLRAFRPLTRETQSSFLKLMQNMSDL